MAPWKSVFLYQPVVSRVHVSLPGSKYASPRQIVGLGNGPAWLPAMLRNASVHPRRMELKSTQQRMGNHGSCRLLMDQNAPNMGF